MGGKNYQISVRPDILREIAKRGTVEQKKDAQGRVIKKRSVNGPTSMIGWGTVDDTLPAVKKDIVFVRQNLNKILEQLVAPPPVDEIDELFNLDAPQPHTPADYLKEKRQEKQLEKHILQTAQEPIVQTSHIPQIIVNWYKGSLPVRVFLSTPEGRTLLDFCSYLKLNF
jgi:hypothetical protein